MAEDPGFIFYPGDYLRDTQVLSEKSQVAYDRIMCEHMRNICITPQQLKFLTKKLNDDEKEELLMVLTETDEGFCIKWVVDSIKKRRLYSESRRNNRKKKEDLQQSDINNISKSYVTHMDNENEIDNIYIDDVLNNKDENSKKIELELLNALLDKFNIREMRFAPQQRKISELVSILSYNNQMQMFIDSLRDYEEYKTLSAETIHKFDTLLGTAKESFLDGAWNAENWAHKTEQFKLRQNTHAEKKSHVQETLESNIKVKAANPFRKPQNEQSDNNNQ